MQTPLLPLTKAALLQPLLLFLQKKTNRTCPARLWEIHQCTGREPRSLEVTPGASWGPRGPGFIQRLAKGAPQVNKLGTASRALATPCPFPLPPPVPSCHQPGSHLLDVKSGNPLGSPEPFPDSGREPGPGPGVLGPISPWVPQHSVTWGVKVQAPWAKAVGRS